MILGVDMSAPLVVTEAVVARLAANPKALAEFPFLRQTVTRQRGCCGGPRTQKFKDALIALSWLPPSKIAVLKSILGVDRIEFQIYTKGQVSRRIF